MAELEMRRIRTGSHHLKAIAFAFCTVSANASALLRTFRPGKERCRFLYLRKMTPLLFALISAGFFNVGPVRVCIPGNGVTPFFGSSSSHRLYNLSVADMERIFTAFLRTIHGFLPPAVRKNIILCKRISFESDTERRRFRKCSRCYFLLCI